MFKECMWRSAPSLDGEGAIKQNAHLNIGGTILALLQIRINMHAYMAGPVYKKHISTKPRTPNCRKPPGHHEVT